MHKAPQPVFVLYGLKDRSGNIPDESGIFCSTTYTKKARQTKAFDLTGFCFMPKALFYEALYLSNIARTSSSFFVNRLTTTARTRQIINPGTIS